jgi:RNA polymerase II elongation factor ELL
VGDTHIVAIGLGLRVVASPPELDPNPPLGLPHCGGQLVDPPYLRVGGCAYVYESERERERERRERERAREREREREWGREGERERESERERERDRLVRESCQIA